MKPTGGFGRGQVRVVIRKHKTLEAFRDVILADMTGGTASSIFKSTINETAVMESLYIDEDFTVSMVPLFHANAGHALYDYLYPSFLELANWGLGHRDFSVFVHFPNNKRSYADNPMNVQAQQRHERIFGIFGGLGLKGDGHPLGSNGSTMTDYDYPQIFGDMLVGIGANIDEIDANINYTLPGGVSSLDAVRKFRDRLMDKFDILVKRRPSSPRTALRAIVVQSASHHSVSESTYFEAVAEAARYGVKLKYVYWPDIGFDEEGVTRRRVGYPSGLEKGSPPAAFAAQLRLLAKTDIHISGPGTSMMYQQLLRDGSVHVNLGNKKISSPHRYMDEFMAEGSQHIRCLYAHFTEDDFHPKTENGRAIGRLAGIAARLVREGFEIPVPRGINLSPTSTLLKAYAHLRYGKGLDPLTPFWAYEGDRGLCKNKFGNFDWMAGVTNAPDKNIEVDDPCLLAALGRNYNQGDPMNLGWFSPKKSSSSCPNISSVRPSSY